MITPSVRCPSPVTPWRPLPSAPSWAAGQIAVADQHLRYYAHFDCRALFGGIRFGSLRLIVRCPQVQGGSWTGVTLTHRYKLESDRQEYFFPLKKLKWDKDHYIAIASVPLKQFCLLPPLLGHRHDL